MNEMLFCILGLIIANVILSLILLKQIEILKKQTEKISITNKEDNKTTRKHLSIGQSDFDNAFGGRKAYSMFKNQNGLYEPVTPSRGIPIEKKEE